MAQNQRDADPSEGADQSGKPTREHGRCRAVGSAIRNDGDSEDSKDEGHR
jgi:hypothetical protein